MNTMKSACVVATFLLLAVPARATTMTVASVTGQCGSQVTVPVSVDSVSGMLALEFSISYDSSKLTFSDATVGTLTNGFTISSHATGGVLKVAMASGSDVSGSGSVAIITFSIANTASGNIPLGLSNATVNDVPVTSAGGSVTVNCATAPGAVSNPTPANGATGVVLPVTLSWNAATGASSYSVAFGTANPPPSAGTTQATSFPVSANAGTTYYWQVTAVNSTANTPGPLWSFTTAASPSPCKVPAAPTLSGPSSADSGSSYSVAWAAVANATAYKVDEATDVGFTSSTTTTVAGNTLTAAFSHDVSSSTVYYYRVKAVNAASPCNEAGPLSNVVSVEVTPHENPPPPQLFLLTVTAGSGGSVRKTPDNPAYALGTLVVVKAAPDSGYVFEGWSGDAGGSDNPLNVTMDRNKVIQAKFGVGRRRAAAPPVGPTGDFREMASLAVPRFSHSMVVMADGRVLITGGYTTGGDYPGSSSTSNVAEIYDPVKNIVSRAGSLNTARANHRSTLLRDGHVLITGGAGDMPATTAEIFDPTAQTFRSIPGLNIRRIRHTATLLQDGTVLIAGGIAASGNGFTPPAEIYNPATETFQSVGSMSVARSDHVAILLDSGEVFITGGTDCGVPSTAEIYNPQTRTFRLAASPSVSRPYSSAAKLLTGEVLVAGVECGSATGSAELYDPRTNSYSRVGALSRPKSMAIAVTIMSGVVVIVGGYVNGIPTADAELYEHTTKTLNLPYGHGYIGCGSAVAIDNRVILTGGWWNSPLSDIVVYIGGRIPVPGGPPH